MFVPQRVTSAYIPMNKLLLQCPVPALKVCTINLDTASVIYCTPTIIIWNLFVRRNYTVILFYKTTYLNNFHRVTLDSL